jgi:hypothetical protein
MAITTAMCNSFKQELLGMATHVNTDTFKIVLIKGGHAGTYGASTTAVGTPGSSAPSTSNLGTDAVTASGDYNSVNGMTLASLAASLDGSTGLLTFADPAAWTGTTISADGAIIYNSSKSNKAVAVFSFGGTVTSTGGNFDVNLPAVAAATALIRIA